MEDFLALTLVLAVFGLFCFIVWKFQQRVKRDAERRLEQQKRLEELKPMYVPSQWNPVVLNEPKKKTSAKKKTIGQTYANMNTPTASTSSTVTSKVTSPASSDDGFLTGMLTGMLIDNITHSHHSSEPSPGISISTKDDTSSWGLDDSDSRKSISDSMDTSSSWSSSSSDFGSSDSGPSSDW